MNYFEIATILIFLSAMFGYINSRFIKLPTTIGLMLVSIFFTFGVFIISYFDDTLLEAEVALVAQIDFKTLLLDGMLSFLLFAGALHTDFQALKALRRPIISFATIGVLTSTFLIGSLFYFIFPLIGLEINYVLCLLFGALISPTDPIAVLGILKQANAPKKLETLIVGESLFNDGVGVVVFTTIFTIAKNSAEVFSLGFVLEIFVKEVGGGILLGLLLGYLAIQLMKRIDDYDIEVIITLAVVMVGTLIAQRFHFSAPLAMVVAGLMIGNNRNKEEVMSAKVREYTDKFWELIDMLLNTILFVLIGMEMLNLSFRWSYFSAGLIAIPIVLASRYLSLYLPVKYYEKRLDFEPHTLEIMTWGGLRGAISIALALNLTHNMQNNLFIFMTYIVVVFSILVQGLTIGPLIKRFFKHRPKEVSSHH